MPIPTKRKSSGKKKAEKKLPFFKRVREKIVSGLYSGIEDFSKKATLSVLGALTLILTAFAVTHFGDFRASVIGNIFGDGIDINALMENAQPGGTIFIPEGDYHFSDVSVLKDIQFVGEGDVVITGDDEDPIFLIEEDVNVSFKNITFQEGMNAIVAYENSNVSVEDCVFSDHETAVSAHNASSMTIRNSYFTGSDRTAISLKGVPAGEIMNNTFERNRNGMTLDDSRITASYNILKETTENGFYLFHDQSRFSYNIVKDVPYGVGVNFRRGEHLSTFTENYFSNMPIGFYALSYSKTKGIRIERNVFDSISENTFVLPDTSDENYMENVLGSSGNENVEYSSLAGCTLNECL